MPSSKGPSRPEMEPTFPAWQVDSLTTEPPGNVISHFGQVLKGNVFVVVGLEAKGSFVL